MLAQALLYILLLYVAAYTTHRSCTSPNPPPKEVESSKDVTPTVRFFGKVAAKLGDAVKIMTWASAGCTAAVLIAREYPNALSTMVLRKLFHVGIGAAARVQLTPTVLLGLGLTVLGAGLRMECYRVMDRFFVFVVMVRDGHQLCQRGPYSIVRHPSYTGWCIQTVGLPLWTCGAGSWAREAGWLTTPVGVALANVYIGLQVYAVVGMIMRCGQEDALMRKQFGKTWDEWARQVPYRLIPLVY